jgi:hypothetical protein
VKTIRIIAIHVLSKQGRDEGTARVKRMADEQKLIEKRLDKSHDLCDTTGAEANERKRVT